MRWKQTVKIMTTISRNEPEFAEPFLNFMKSLLDDGWSLDIDLSKSGGCWEVSGYKEAKEKRAWGV